MAKPSIRDRVKAIRESKAAAKAPEVPPTPDNKRVHMQAAMNEMVAQRNEALGRCMMLAGQIAVLQAELKAVKDQLDQATKADAKKE